MDVHVLYGAEYWMIFLRGKTVRVPVLKVPDRVAVDLALRNLDLVQHLIDDFVELFGEQPYDIIAERFGKPYNGTPITHVWQVSEIIAKCSY